MKFKALRRNWEEFATTDPLFAIASHPGKEGGRWDPEDFLATGRDQVDDLMSQIADLGGCGHETALDFGCGYGRLSQALAQYFDSVTGVDVATAMIEGAEEFNRQGSKCRFVVNARDDLSLFEDASFDLVFTLAVLQHMEPQYSLGYLGEFFRVAKPGGIVAFQIPHPLKYQALKLALPDPVVTAGRRLRLQRGPVMEMYGLPAAQVKAAVTAAGGSVVRTTPKNSAPTCPGTLYFCRRGAG